jgi:outer membrane immunogenic protein
MRRILLATASTIAISTSAAMAADLAPMPTKAPAPITASWTGGYVGLNAGYAWGNSDPTLFAPGPANASPLQLGTALGTTPGLRPKGFIGGGQAGYNWQLGQFVVGGEVDFSGLDTKADASVSPFFSGKNSAPNTFNWSSRYDWLFTARLRGGFTIAPNWLLYASGGLAVTQARDSASCMVPANNGACGDFLAGTNLFWAHSETLVGGVVGGGVETMFAPNWTARVEYLYAKFADTTADPVNQPDPTPTVPQVPALFSFRHELNLVRVGINYKFTP